MYSYSVFSPLDRKSKYQGCGYFYSASASEVYEGEYKDDKKHGKGRAKLKASATYRTKVWKDGREGDTTVDVAEVLVSTRKVVIEVQATVYAVDCIERQATEALAEIEK